MLMVLRKVSGNLICSACFPLADLSLDLNGESVCVCSCGVFVLACVCVCTLHLQWIGIYEELIIKIEERTHTHMHTPGAGL